MKFEKEDLLLYAVTDRSWIGTSSLELQVEAAIRGGATMVQLREKYLTGTALEEQALAVQRVCRKYQIPFLINDNVALARRIHADGVHVGQSDIAAEKARALLGADRIIGVTAKTVEQALAAEAAGADYLGSGAVFGSGTKSDAIKLDHDVLDKICDSVSIPVVAIGGIHADNILQLKGRKMNGFAVVSGIFHNADITSATRTLRTLAEQTVFCL